MAEFSIVSENLKTKSSIAALFNFLSDFNNFGKIMPEDKIEDFISTEDFCSFTIKGITPLKITCKEKTPFTRIVFASEGLAKFNFILEANFIGSPEDTGECAIKLHGDINPFIKMMAEKPLTQLVNSMALKLSQLTIENGQL